VSVGTDGARGVVGPARVETVGNKKDQRSFPCPRALDFVHPPKEDKRRERKHIREWFFFLAPRVSTNCPWGPILIGVRATSWQIRSRTVCGSDVSLSGPAPGPGHCFVLALLPRCFPSLRASHHLQFWESMSFQWADDKRSGKC